MTRDNDSATRISDRENKLDLVERLADDLAHEIRNPLHSMVINLEVLRRRLANLETPATDDLLRYARIIGSELERANHRIDLLLRMVRPSATAGASVTLAELIDDLSEIVGLECERHRVKLHTELDPALAAARVPADPTRQIILNLALETLDSAPAGGVVSIASDPSSDPVRIRLSATDAEGTIVQPASAAEHHPLVSAARTLATRMGGSVELISPEAVDNGVDAPAPTLFILSIPRDRAPAARGTSLPGDG